MTAMIDPQEDQVVADDAPVAGEGGTWHVSLAVFLLSVALLMFEILQTVTLSLQIFSSNAFLVISVALFGLGAGGSMASYLTRSGRPMPRRWLWAFCLAFACSLLVTAVLNSRAFGVVPLIAFSVGPYFCVGLFLSGVFHRWTGSAGRLYFFNLAGSAFGCVGVVWALDTIGDAGLVHFVIAFLALAAAACLALPLSRRALALTGVAAVLVALLLPLSSTLFSYLPSPDKTYGRIARADESMSTLVWSRWSYLGRIDSVIPYGGIGFAYFDGWVQDTDGGSQSLVLFASGDNWTTLVDFGGDDAYRQRFVREMVPSAPYAFFEAPSVLNIGVGGGVDVFLALEHGARSVVGVEIHPLMIEAIQERHSEYFDGAANDPRVEIVELDGRTFVDQSPERFDVVTLTAVDTGAGLASGAYILSESYLYTQEAFESYLELLEEGGVLFAYRPRLQLLRLLTTASAALRELGAEHPAEHMAVFGGGPWVGALIAREPLGPERRALLEGRLARGDFGGPERGAAGTGNEGFLARYLEELAAGREQEFLERFALEVRPVEDDQPFFYHQERPFSSSPAGELLLTILGVVGVAAAFLIFLPLVALERSSRATRRASTLTYFFAIGLAFMLVEIALIQKLALFLGHPSHSLTVTMFTILVFSGLGSLTVDRLPRLARGLQGAAILGVVLIAVFYSVGMSPLLASLQVESLAGRVGIVVALMAPGSYLMGFPFPSMIRRLSGENRSLICWAWGFNSLASVVASIAAVIVSMNFGFSVTLQAGALCYVVAAAALWRHGR
jgi:hypothetical protein